jgi:hypothetical protein
MFIQINNKSIWIKGCYWHWWQRPHIQREKKGGAWIWFGPFMIHYEADCFASRINNARYWHDNWTSSDPIRKGYADKIYEENRVV